jgi:tetratricopeptide (TPR) repeat protein
MRLRRIIGWIGTGLLLSSGLCFAQVAADTQEQIARHNRKIQQYLQEEKPDLAIPEFQAVVALDPNNADARGNLGVLLFFKGDCVQAAPQLRAATTQKEGLWRIQVLLGICERRQGDLASARADFEAAYPHLDDQKVRVEAGMELVEIYTGTGDLDKAAAIIEPLRSSNPTNVSVLYAAYRVYSQLAGEAMLSLSMVDPDSAQMHRVMAQEETRQGNADGAIAQYRKVLAIDPHMPGIHFELAELLNTSRDIQVQKEALAEYRAALAANPNDEKTLCKLGEIDAGKGNISQAYAEYSKAVELEPADAEAKLGLAGTLLEMNQPEKALALLEQTIQLEPTNATAHYRLGMLYRKNGRLEDAEREVELYKKYKEMKEKLNGIYKEMQMLPSQIRADQPDHK